jgi:hypothetical protein
MAITSDAAGPRARHYLLGLSYTVTVGSIVAATLFLLLGLLLLTPRFNIVDDAHYILCAQALAAGQGYRDIHLPTQPLHRLFPPGMAVFLALPTWIAGQCGISFDTLIIIYKLLLLSCVLFSIYGLAIWAQNQNYPPQQIIASLLLMVTSITLLSHTYRVASEVLYILLTILLLLSLARYLATARLFSPWLLLTAGLLGALFLTRTVAIALLGALFIQALVTRQFRRPALLWLIMGLFLLPWFWYTAQANPGVSRYWGDMWLQYQINDPMAANNLIGAISRQVVKNAVLMLDQEIPRMICSLIASQTVRDYSGLNLVCLPLRWAISLVTLAVIAKNCINPSRNLQLVSFYILIYTTIILVWPWEPSRFLLPLLPFYCLSFVAGLQELIMLIKSIVPKLMINPWPNRRFHALNTTIAICLLAQLVSVGRLTITVRQTADYTAATALVWNDLMGAYQWIRQETAPTSILACAPTIEAHAFLYTRRQAIPLPAKLNLLYQAQANYILKVQDVAFNGTTGLQQAEIDFRRLTKKFPYQDLLPIVYRNENVVIYRIDRAKVAAFLGNTVP